MNTMIKEFALALTLIWLWLGLSACSKASKAAPQVTQTALLPTAVGQPTLLDEQNPTPTASGTEHPLAGLVYKQMDTAETWQIGNEGQHHLLINSPFATTSWDGHSAIYEEDDDLWLSDLQTGALRMLTATPDRIEWHAQWWPGNQAIIIFQSLARSSWTPSEAGQLSIINFDGSNYSVLSDILSIGLPSPSPDGKTIAFDQNGTPWIYDLDTGMRPFDPSEYGNQAIENQIYFSPSWSADGLQLSWWVETSQADARYQLVVFDLKNQRYFLTDTYDPPDSVTWRPQAPFWSYDGQWLAYITRDEVSWVDLYIIHPDGSDSHRFGLATDPVWSPNDNQLVFTQWPPRSDSYLAAEPYLVSAPSWVPVKIDLPEGSIPSAWLAEAAIPGSSSLTLPMFSLPEWWKTYSNPELGFEFHYPPDAVLETENGALNINFPFNPGTTMEVKSITVDVRPVVEETCYGGLNWQGVIPINGVDFKYFQGKMWEQAMGGLSFFRSDFATFNKELCYRIALRMAVRDDSGVSGNPPKPTPDRDDLDIEVLLNVLSTFKITR